MMSADKLCAICGREKALTHDHVPPKGIFPKPRPADLITVPTCFSCNNSASKEDESFRVFLSLHVGIDTREKQALWEEAIRSTRHNRRLMTYIVDNAKQVSVRTPAGIILSENSMAVRWDSKAHDMTLERTIRGLYYHHFGEILGTKANINVHWLRGLSDEIIEMFKILDVNRVGGDALIYGYGRADESPMHSLWIFQFYRRHWASGYTRPVNLNISQ